MFMPLTRRSLLQIAALSGLLLPVASSVAFAQASEDAPQSVPLSDLLTPGALPDAWIGSKDAPVTIIEYASMTCPHCAAFHAETWPALKTKYVDTGKVRFVLREFPLDPLATAGFMLARCAGPDKRNALTDLLFDQQKNWAFVDKPVDALASTVRQAGITQAQFESCLKDQTLFSQVNQMRDQASSKFNIQATPTFFINGKKYTGELSVAQMDKDIEDATKK
jgi:protein-disulfide isomerase